MSMDKESGSQPGNDNPGVDGSLEEQGITTSGKLVRLFVGGLPLGLIIMGALSFVIWNYKKKEKPPTVMEFASLLQRDVNEADYLRYVDLITNEIGTSQLSPEQKSDAVAGFVESSMGMENMGYETRRRKTSNGGWLVYSELPAARSSKGILLVVADATDAELNRQKASSVAALMSVAHAMTGKGYGRKVRFAVVKSEEALREVAKDASRVLEISNTPKDSAVVFVDDGKEIAAKLQQLQQVVEAAAR